MEKLIPELVNINEHAQPEIIPESVLITGKEIEKKWVLCRENSINTPNF